MRGQALFVTSFMRQITAALWLNSAEPRPKKPTPSRVTGIAHAAARHVGSSSRLAGKNAIESGQDSTAPLPARGTTVSEATRAAAAAKGRLRSLPVESAGHATGWQLPL